MTWIDDLKAKYSMFEGIHYANFGVGNGWQSLVEELCADLDAMKIENLRVVQIKEKFGTLRFYISTHNTPAEYDAFLPEHKDRLELVYKRIHLTEEQSASICEFCGKPGQLYQESWWNTLCPKCHEKKHNKNENRF